MSAYFFVINSDKENNAKAKDIKLFLLPLLLFPLPAENLKQNENITETDNTF